jgi:metallo-beta-lactamase family protein
MTMKLQFYGAAGCVTGSCHLLKIGNKKILLDCGLYQGKDEKDIGNEEFDFNPKEIDYVILSMHILTTAGEFRCFIKEALKVK